METEISSRPSFFHGATEDDPLLGGPIGEGVPAVRARDDETIILGMAVLYTGSVANRGDDEFVGIVIRVHDTELDLLILAPGKGWAPGTEAFKEVRAPKSAVRQLRSRYSIGQRAIFKVREEDHAESLGVGFRAVPTVRYEAVFDEESNSTHTKVIRSPGRAIEQPVHKGSVHHKDMVEFAALIIRPYEDESVDLLIFVPGRPEPNLVRGVHEGDGAGAFSLVD